jgi:glycosyltransferase involved in cell wall biosynthesis
LFPPGDLARLEWCLRNASRLVAVSADLARKVRVLVDRDATVLPNAVDTAVFAPGLPRARGAEAVLGFSGELRAKKGLPFLLQAVDHVRRHMPARLLVIGEVRGGDRGEWERLLIGLGLADAVSVTGHLNHPADVAAALRSCDLFLLPSLWEGMPNGLLEAMAAGVPVVASDAGGIPEILEDGVNGVLVPRTHLHQFGPRALDVLRMPEARRGELIKAALRTVSVRHSPEVERANLQALLASMSS